MLLRGICSTNISSVPRQMLIELIHHTKHMLKSFLTHSKSKLKNVCKSVHGNANRLLYDMQQRNQHRKNDIQTSQFIICGTVSPLSLYRLEGKGLFGFLELNKLEAHVVMDNLLALFFMVIDVLNISKYFCDLTLCEFGLDYCSSQIVYITFIY